MARRDTDGAARDAARHGAQGRLAEAFDTKADSRGETPMDCVGLAALGGEAADGMLDDVADLKAVIECCAARSGRRVRLPRRPLGVGVRRRAGAGARPRGGRRFHRGPTGAALLGDRRGALGARALRGRRGLSLGDGGGRTSRGRAHRRGGAPARRRT